MKSAIYLILLLSLLGCGKEYEKQFYDNGNIKLKAELKDGKKDGKLTSYFENGEIETIQEWKDGLVHGETVYYFKNGNISSVSNYIKGKQEGIYKKYYEDGSLKAKGVFKDDHPIDTLKFYYRNGKLMEAQIYNRKGILMDFYKYNEKGNQKLEARIPIFIPQYDTIAYGKQYEIEIRAANTVFDSIQIVIGQLDETGSLDWNKPYKILNKQKGGGFEYILEAESRGLNVLRGVINDIKSGDTLTVHEIPFEFPYFAVDTTGSEAI